MLKISHKLFLVILFFSLVSLFVLAHTPWNDEATKDGITVTYLTKNHECFVSIRRDDGKGNQDGAAIKTIEKATRLGTRERKNPAIQWNFYSIVNGKEYRFPLWGENYEEDSGPEISSKCLGQLQSLPGSVQKELHKYGVPF